MIILVDHQNVLHRAYHSSKMMGEKIPWLPVIRYLEMVRNCAKHVRMHTPGYPPIKFIFAGESVTPLVRTLVDPMYKKRRGVSRTDNDNLFHMSETVILTILEHIGAPPIHKNGLEADDVIASVVQNNPEEEIVILSNDRDLRQLLAYPYTKIYQTPSMFYTNKMFKEDYGFCPERFVFYKALVGDKSDGVDGVPGWGPAKARKHITSNDWMNVLEDDGSKESYWRAMELVRLRFDPTIEESGRFIGGNVGEMAKLRDKLNALYCSKFLADLPKSERAKDEILITLGRLSYTADYDD